MIDPRCYSCHHHRRRRRRRRRRRLRADALRDERVVTQNTTADGEWRRRRRLVSERAHQKNDVRKKTSKCKFCCRRSKLRPLCLSIRRSVQRQRDRKLRLYAVRHAISHVSRRRRRRQAGERASKNDARANAAACGWL